MAAFSARKGATKGTQEAAEQIVLETQDIQYKFETRAKELNSEIKTIFDAARKDASRLQEEIVYKAREEAEALVKKNREEIRSGVQKSKEELKKYIPELTQSISNKLLGKEVH